jgi:acetolactate synthase-1/2/3 large subunit
MQQIRQARAEEAYSFASMRGSECGVHPMPLIRALRCALPDDGLLFVDVTISEHLAAEGFRVCLPRTYFNPTDNQAMGWSIPAALGAQRALPRRTVATITGDGCLLMTAMELSTAARACLPVKFFILDDHAYHYMQELQWAAYRRVTATRLARVDYAALAKGLGLGYAEITRDEHLAPTIHAVLAHPGPVLCRVAIDYRNVKFRWIDAVRERFTEELTLAQKARFLARLTARNLDRTPQND